MKNKIAYLLGKLIGFIFKVWRFYFKFYFGPINRYRNKRRYKKEMAKLNKAMIRLTTVMQKAAEDINKLNEDFFKRLGVNNG